MSSRREQISKTDVIGTSGGSHLSPVKAEVSGEWWMIPPQEEHLHKDFDQAGHLRPLHFLDQSW